MNIYIINNPFHYEIENLTRAFFNNEKMNVIKCDKNVNREKPFVAIELIKHEKDSDIIVSFADEDFEKTLSKKIDGEFDSEYSECERAAAIMLFEILSEYTGIRLPWGILTGVRPIKLLHNLVRELGTDGADKYFREKLLVTEQKTKLALTTEKNERKILELSKPDSFSLYISVPFCPTRCSYCSFVSQSIEKAKKLVEPYLDLLCQEIKYTAEIAKELNLRLETVYIGGGTPTTFSAEQLTKLITAINTSFDMKKCREFTIEAGRPDTITREKLEAILDGGCDRISINPQTLNDEVLEAIGRRHTATQTLEAYKLAEKIGFKHINMDLITGLPKDTPETFKYTLDTLCDLSPASITVHTLAMKRSSFLTLGGTLVKTGAEPPAAIMMKYCEEKLPQFGYHPYYLYRQSRMEGNLENVGWSKDGFDGLYNVYVMDETHTILACGAGGVSKLREPGVNHLERIFNYKYPYEYINGFDEMLRRKEQIKTFYGNLK